VSISVAVSQIITKFECMLVVQCLLGPFYGAIAVPSVTHCHVVVAVVDIDAQAACDSGGV